jgi:hypothetical protein
MTKQGERRRGANREADRPGNPDGHEPDDCSGDDDLSPDQSFSAGFNEPGEPGEKGGIHGAKVLRWPGNPN